MIDSEIDELERYAICPECQHDRAQVVPMDDSVLWICTECGHATYGKLGDEDNLAWPSPGTIANLSEEEVCSRIKDVGQAGSREEYDRNLDARQEFGRRMVKFITKLEKIDPETAKIFMKGCRVDTEN